MGHRKANKSPTVLQGSAARLCISVPMCNQSTASNPHWHIGSRESTIKRVHRVTPGANGTTSSEAQVRSGVPQGSVLGPLPFLIHISDKNYEISDSTVSFFANDTRILLE